MRLEIPQFIFLIFYFAEKQLKTVKNMKTTGNRFRYFIDNIEVFDFEEFNRKFDNKDIEIKINNFDIHGRTI